MIETAVAGGPLGVDALAELLWYTHPDSGDSPANSWLEENEYVKGGFRASAEVLASWVLPTVRRQGEKEDAEALRWLTYIGAVVEACPPATGDPGPSWQLYPKGYRECIVKHPDLRGAVLLLRARVLHAGLMVIIDTTDGSVASPWAMPGQVAAHQAEGYGRRVGDPDRFVLHPAHLEPGS